MYRLVVILAVLSTAVSTVDAVKCRVDMCGLKWTRNNCVSCWTRTATDRGSCTAHRDFNQSINQFISQMHELIM